MELFLDLLIIFVLRVLDVGMATVRIVLLSRGRKGWAASLLGFFESLVWVLAIARVLSGLDDPARVLAFAAGFAAGTYGGALVEEWLAIGQSSAASHRAVRHSERGRVACGPGVTGRLWSTATAETVRCESRSVWCHGEGSPRSWT